MYNELIQEVCICNMLKLKNIHFVIKKKGISIVEIKI